MLKDSFPWQERPDKVLYYLLGQGKTYELTGDVPNVLFPRASLQDKETDKLALYYGVADRVTALAFGHISEIVEFVKNNSL